jgi:D-glycero-D-manno-heptose 1,7-bisphosphate phosphatase
MLPTPAVFLDRDGVTNRNALISRIEQLEIFSFTVPAIKLLNQLNLPIIFITNQAVVARGLCTKNQAQKIQEYLVSQLENQGAHITASYYCPHHPQATLPKYRLHCPNRKPHPGLFYQAARELKLELNSCFLVGDSLRFDISAGKTIGATTILVKTGLFGAQESPSDISDTNRPDHIEENLLTAARLICKLTH